MKKIIYILIFISFVVYSQEIEKAKTETEKVSPSEKVQNPKKNKKPEPIKDAKNETIGEVIEQKEEVEPLGKNSKKDPEDDLLKDFEDERPTIGYRRGRTFLELKTGFGYGGGGVFPYMFEFLFEFGKGNNWAFGFGMKTVRYSYENFVNYDNLTIHYQAYMFDFAATYHFVRNSKFDPFLRTYVGVGAVPGDTGLNSGGFLHLGLGGGVKYHFSQKYYVTSELILDKYLGSPGHAGNEFFLNLQLGAGATF